MNDDIDEEIEKLSLILKVMIPSLLLFLCFGMIMYSILEKWSLFDSLYFSVITITTVGYGDIYPHTILGKTFTMFYLFIGIGLFIYVANTFLKHRAFIRLKKRSDRKKLKNN